MENWTAFSHLHTTEALKYIHMAHCENNAIFMKLSQQLLQSLTNQLHSSITKRALLYNVTRQVTQSLNFRTSF